MTDTTTNTDGPWYTITVTQHDTHPQLTAEPDSKSVEVIACTVLPHLAGDVLRATAEQIAPKKPTMRGADSRRVKP
jgi:hypothetical protein